MTDQEILTQFEELVDDTINDTLAIQLANTTKNKLEREMKLEICKRIDESNTAQAGQTYTTGIALPSGFRGLARDYIYVGNRRHFVKPFEDSPLYRNTGGWFYINHGSSTLHLTGTQGSEQTIYIPYIFKTPDISTASIEAGTTTVTWPTEFHSIIPYDMVKLFDQIERGDKNRSWRAEWDNEYILLKNVLRDWDHDLKLAAIGRSTPYDSESFDQREYQINLD